MKHLVKLNDLVTLTTAMTGSKRALRERAALIGKRPRALVITAAALLLAAVTAAAAACADGDRLTLRAYEGYALEEITNGLAAGVYCYTGADPLDGEKDGTASFYDIPAGEVMVVLEDGRGGSLCYNGYGQAVPLPAAVEKAPYLALTSNGGTEPHYQSADGSVALRQSDLEGVTFLHGNFYEEDGLVPVLVARDGAQYGALMDAGGGIAYDTGIRLTLHQAMEGHLRDDIGYYGAGITQGREASTRSRLYAGGKCILRVTGMRTMYYANGILTVALKDEAGAYGYRAYRLRCPDGEYAFEKEAAFEAAWNAPQTPNVAAPTYTVAEIGANGEVLCPKIPLKAELAMDIIGGTEPVPADWGMGALPMEDHFHIEQTLPNGYVRDYYVFAVPGGEALYNGETGEYGRADEALYQELIGYVAMVWRQTPPDRDYSGFDRTDMTDVAEEFLTRYFDDMAVGNTAWGDYDGLILHSPLYAEDMALVRQWISYKAYLGETGYSVEEDMGRFATLDRLIPSKPAGEGIDRLLEGYFRTTAFGASVTLGMAKRENGELAVVYADFPDSKEYQSFRDGFRDYMEKNGYEDYNKTMYIDHLRQQRDAALNEWKDGRRRCEPFAPHRSVIETSYYGARLNSNGTEQTQAMREGNVDLDAYTRPEEGETLLQIARVLKGTTGAEDLVGYAMENYDLGQYLTQSVTKYDPAAFFGDPNTPITRLVRRVMRCRADSPLGYVQERAHTVYYAQFPYENQDVALLFNFTNAYKNQEGEWELCQTGEDCEAWMRTLVFSS